MTRVTVVDYGVGNLLSVRRALEKCGALVEFATQPYEIAAADKLVLPGVGAFADGMGGLRERALVEPLKEFAAGGRPLLGICLGMQLLLSESDEFGRTPGLEIIPGRVVAVPSTDSDGAPHKIPHIAWSSLQLPASVDSWAGSVLAGVEPGDAVYMVHSFTALPDDADHRLADCYYGGRLISAAIRSGNVYGCQFHPEKSGSVGLGILAQFIQL
jgi:glutamine amidotransferase